MFLFFPSYQIESQGTGKQRKLKNNLLFGPYTHLRAVYMLQHPYSRKHILTLNLKRKSKNCTEMKSNHSTCRGHLTIHNFLNSKNSTGMKSRHSTWGASLKILFLANINSLYLVNCIYTQTKLESQETMLDSGMIFKQSLTSVSSEPYRVFFGIASSKRYVDSND